MKKALWITILIVILVLLAFIWITRTRTYLNDTYRFSFNYIATYKEFYNPNTLISLQNYDGSIIIDVVATKNESSYTKSISELGEGYVNLLKIFNEDYNYEIIKDETVRISGGKSEAREVTVKINDGKNIQIERAVLIPALGREITFVIRGTEKAMDQKAKQIDKIVKSIKLY